MGAQIKSNPEKVYFQGMVSKEVADEFISYAVVESNFKKGWKGINLEHAMNLYNQYFKKINDQGLVEICENNDIEYWELGEHILTIALLLYRYADDELKELLISPLLKYQGPYHEDVFIDLAICLKRILKAHRGKH